MMTVIISLEIRILLFIVTKWIPPLYQSSEFPRIEITKKNMRIYLLKCINFIYIYIAYCMYGIITDISRFFFKFNTTINRFHFTWNV